MNELNRTYNQRIDLIKDVKKYFKKYDKTIYKKDILQKYLFEKEKNLPSSSLQSERDLVLDLKSDVAFMNRVNVEGEMLKQEDSFYAKRNFSEELDYFIKYARVTYRTANAPFSGIEKILTEQVMERKYLPPISYDVITYKLGPIVLSSDVDSNSLGDLYKLLSFTNRRGEYLNERKMIVERLDNAKNNLAFEKTLDWFFSKHIFELYTKRVSEYYDELVRYDCQYGPFDTNLDAFEYHAKREGVADEFITYVNWFYNTYENDIEIARRDRFEVRESNDNYTKMYLIIGNIADY